MRASRPLRDRACLRTRRSRARRARGVQARHGLRRLHADRRARSSFEDPCRRDRRAVRASRRSSLVNNNIWAGLANDPLSGALDPTATAVGPRSAGRRRLLDPGRRALPASRPPTIPSYSATLQFSQGIVLGSYTLVVRAVDQNGNFGLPATQILVAEASPLDPPATGDLVVTLTWDTESNLDLHVVDPAGAGHLLGQPVVASRRPVRAATAAAATATSTTTRTRTASSTGCGARTPSGPQSPAVRAVHGAGRRALAVRAADRQLDGAGGPARASCRQGERGRPGRGHDGVARAWRRRPRAPVHRAVMAPEPGGPWRGPLGGRSLTAEAALRPRLRPAPRPRPSDGSRRPAARRSRRHRRHRPGRGRRARWRARRATPSRSSRTSPGSRGPPSGSGQLIVWGSAPAERGTYVDGVEIPALFHGSALRSTVNGDLVRDGHAHARRLRSRLRPSARRHGARRDEGPRRQRRPRLRAAPTRSTAPGWSPPRSATACASRSPGATDGSTACCRPSTRPNVDEFFAVPRYGDYQAQGADRAPTARIDRRRLPRLRRRPPRVHPRPRPVPRRAARPRAPSYERLYLRYRRAARRRRERRGRALRRARPELADARFGATPATLDESTRALGPARVAPLARRRARSRSPWASSSTARARRSSAKGRCSSRPARATSRFSDSRRAET